MSESSIVFDALPWVNETPHVEDKTLLAARGLLTSRPTVEFLNTQQRKKVYPNVIGPESFANNGVF